MGPGTRPTEKVDFSEVRETMLATLYTRALDARSPAPILNDRFADELVQRIDYDFDQMKLRKADSWGIAIRARHLDDWTRDFLVKHPQAIVLHLACGLDSRVFRIDPGPGVSWFDIDYPDTIALRERLYPKRPGYQTISTSVTEPGWLEKLPNDRPVLVIAEGLSMYLSEAENQALWQRITSHFTAGEIIFDAISPFGKASGQRKHVIQKTGALFKWSAKHPEAVTDLHPALKLVESATLFDSPYVRHLQPRDRMVAWAMTLLSALRNVMWMARYRFGPVVWRTL